MYTIAIVSFSSIDSDARVLKQVSCLSKHFNVVTVGYGPGPPLSSFHLTLTSSESLLMSYFLRFLFLLRLYKYFTYIYFQFDRILSFFDVHRPDLFLLNDCSCWPLLNHIPSNLAFCDAHEYSPEELADSVTWRLFYRPYKLWSSKFAIYASKRFSVESNICSLWSDLLSVDFDLLPNSSFYQPSPTPLVLQQRHTRVSFVHHGVAHPSRRIENMILAFSILKKPVSSHFYLTGSNKNYIQNLRSYSTHVDSCFINDPVPQTDLHSVLVTHTYSIISIYPSNPNYQYCLPNKLYQCIQARLPIVTGPTPSIAEIVVKHGIGVVAEDFTPEALALAIEKIQTLSYDMLLFNLNRAAHSLSWDVDQIKLLKATSKSLNYLL